MEMLGGSFKPIKYRKAFPKVMKYDIDFLIKKEIVQSQSTATSTRKGT